jgi:hypothetical protein
MFGCRNAVPVKVWLPERRSGKSLAAGTPFRSKFGSRNAVPVKVAAVPIRSRGFNLKSLLNGVILILI